MPLPCARCTKPCCFCVTLLMFLLALVGEPSAALATLTRTYDPNIGSVSPGGTNLTTDSETGLQWLVPQFQPQLNLVPYIYDSGFRFATRLEVYTFLSHMGLPVGTLPLGGSAPTDLYSAAVPYIGEGNYLANTSNIQLTNTGLTADVAPDGGVYEVTVMYLNHFDFPSPEFPFGNETFTTYVFFSQSRPADEYAGHWMVRAVPEPSGLALCGAGGVVLLGLALRHRPQSKDVQRPHDAF